MKKQTKSSTNRSHADKHRTTQSASRGVKDGQETPAFLRPLLSRQESDLAAPSPSAMERYCSVPLVCDQVSPARPVRGKIVFDSWAGAAGGGLRDAVDGRIRRLKLRAARLTLEIVAERRDNRWEFVARASLGGNVSHRFVLKVGRRKLLPQTGGFYLWNSRTVPHLLHLESFEQNIVFEKLSWR